MTYCLMVTTMLLFFSQLISFIPVIIHVAIFIILISSISIPVISILISITYWVHVISTQIIPNYKLSIPFVNSIIYFALFMLWMLWMFMLFVMFWTGWWALIPRSPTLSSHMSMNSCGKIQKYQKCQIFWIFSESNSILVHLSPLKYFIPNSTLQYGELTIFSIYSTFILPLNNLHFKNFFKSNYTLLLPYYQFTPKFYLKLHFASIYLLFLIDFAHSLPSQSINKVWASNAKSTWSETNRSNLTQLWKIHTKTTPTDFSR